MKQYKKAIADYTRAIELGYRDNFLYCIDYRFRAECCEALGEKEKAKADMKKYEALKKR